MGVTLCGFPLSGRRWEGLRERVRSGLFVLGLFGRERGGEAEGAVDELLAEGVVPVGLGCGADPTGHGAAAHDGGGDAGDGGGPGFALLADAEEQAAATRSEEKIAVEEPCPSSEHGFFGEALGLG